MGYDDTVLMMDKITKDRMECASCFRAYQDRGPNSFCPQHSDPPNICYAKDCNEPIPPNMLMCWPHWRRVPRHVQRDVWASNYLAHSRHESSRLAARASIAAKEGRPLTPEEVQALQDYGLRSDGHPLQVKVTVTE